MMNSLVISHLQYSDVQLSTSDNNLIVTLDNHLIWAVQACNYRSENFLFCPCN